MATLTARKPAKKARTFVAERVARALEELGKPGPLAPRVHEARRDLRKARAVLKLLRPDISKRAYERENVLCREAARILAPARDAHVLLSAFEKLHVDSPRVKGVLAAEVKEAAAALDPGKSRSLISLARAEAGKISPAHAGWSGLKRGLRRSYGAARRAWRRAARTGQDADFHEWRKRVKDERYQVELLSGDAAALEKLADVLGEDHDLAVLRGKLDAADVEALEAVARRQRLLRKKALASAEKLYARSARAYEKELHRCWRRARDLKQ